MAKAHILYGWHLSYFSAKTRGYLRYKGIEFQDRAVDALTLMRRIPAKTGAMVMPVVLTPQDEWLQDTTHIVEVLESRYPDKPVLPGSPRQRIAAQLLEAWADEFWIPTAMHYRWSYPDNYRLFRSEAGQALLPFAPRFVQNRLADYVADKMRGYLAGVGVVPDQFAIMERWTVTMLDALEHHFSQHDYLFGGAPCIADFALIGPLYAHLGRDPEPLRLLIKPRPHLKAWIQRVHDGAPASGTWLADDAIPQTLDALWHSVLREFMPMAQGTVNCIVEATQALPAQRKRLPRSLDSIEFPMAGQAFRRLAMPYVIWMLQRIQNEFGRCNDADQASVVQWLDGHQASDALRLDLGPALTRHGLRVAIA